MTMARQPNNKKGRALLPQQQFMLEFDFAVQGIEPATPWLLAWVTNRYVYL